MLRASALLDGRAPSRRACPIPTSPRGAAATCGVVEGRDLLYLGAKPFFFGCSLRGLTMWQYFQPRSPAMNWCPMSLRALLYRRPSEPSVVQVVFDRAIYLVRLRRHRQARRYTLRIDAASREVVLTMPPRGSVKEAKEFAQKHGGWIAARLKRLPEAAPFAHGIEVPLRGVPHRIVHRRGERGTVWTETDD